MGSAPLTTARTGPAGFARALACALLIGLTAFPPGGLDVLAAGPVESVACGEEGGSEPELTSAAVRHAHPAPDADRPTRADTSRSRRAAARTSVLHFSPPSGHGPAVFRLRC